MSVRIAIVGLSGCGKSTCAQMFERLCSEQSISCERIKLAKPLYDLQVVVYSAAGAELGDGAQDQVLMESLAGHLRRIRPDAIANDFLQRLRSSSSDCVINDDLRDPHVDAVALREQGFKIVRVTCNEEVRRQRLASRGDLTCADESTSELDLMTVDALLDNSADIDTFLDTVRQAARSLL